MLKNLCYKKRIIVKRKGSIDYYYLDKKPTKKVDKGKDYIKNDSIIELKENPKNQINFIKKKRGRKPEKTNIDNKNINNIHDKFSVDNIRMKIKGYYHNFIIAFLNMKSKKLLNKSNKFVKISSDITGNSTVEFNQKLFTQKIKDIIIHISDKFKDKNKNQNCLQSIMKNADNNEEIIQFLNMNYKDMYLNYYLKSNKETFKYEEIDESFEAHIKKLEELYGNKYIVSYKIIAEDLISNFNKLKKRVRRKKNLLIPNFPELNNYNINFKNVNVLDKILISTSTQTDIIKSEDEKENEF